MKTKLFAQLKKIIVLIIIPTSFSFAQTWQIQNSNFTGELKGVHVKNPTTAWACGDNGTLLNTINAGTNWISIVLTGSDLHQVVFKDENTGIVVGDNGTAFVTTSGGQNWVSKSSSTSAQLRNLTYGGGSTFYAVGDDGAVIKSVDDGNNWTVLTSGTTERLLCAAAVNENVWIGGRNGLLLFSNNGGSSFNIMTSPAIDDIKDIQFVNASVGFAAGSNSFFMYTSDGGTNWVSRSTGILQGLNGLHFMDEQNGWIVGGSGTLYSTNNAGLNWLPIQSSTTQDLNSIHSFDGVNAWAVGNSGVITSNYSPTTSIDETNQTIPGTFEVKQNFPNPFNPATVISWQSTQGANTTLKIFNLLGNEVAVLVNEFKPAGSYSVNFDASGLSSGVYVYSLQVNGITSSKKMTLLK
jgi:photosystem II stability/assembly factor-like uncharacterized protein